MSILSWKLHGTIQKEIGIKSFTLEEGGIFIWLEGRYSRFSKVEIVYNDFFPFHDVPLPEENRSS